MKKTTRYVDAPKAIQEALERSIEIDDFLPAPSELIRKGEKERITIAIDKRSLNAFRTYAKKHDAKYQTMINSVIEFYADNHLVK